MAKPSKRFRQSASLVDRSKAYEIHAALDLMKKTATAKFDESVDVAVNLGIDSKKSDQVGAGSPRLLGLGTLRKNGHPDRAAGSGGQHH